MVVTICHIPVLLAKYMCSTIEHNNIRGTAATCGISGEGGTEPSRSEPVFLGSWSFGEVGFFSFVGDNRRLRVELGEPTAENSFRPCSVIPREGGVGGD